jgi:hypothetical protein
MSETLSALIAFVGFLILFSMLVQSVQAALKNLFKLKTGVWERFFVNLYVTEFAYKKTASPMLKSVWERAGTDDSIGDFEKRLNRLNSVVTSAVSQVKELKASLLEIANIDLSQPDADKKILSKTENLADLISKTGGLKLDSLLPIYDKFNSDKIVKFTQKLHAFEKAYPELWQATRNIEKSAIAGFQKDCEGLLTVIESFEKKISDFKIQIENKMDSWLSQINEEYSQNMLKWTIVIGLVFVVCFNADSFSVFKYLLVDSKAQDLLIKKAAEITVTTQKTDANDLNGIISSVNKGKVADAKATIISMTNKVKEDFDLYKDKDGAEAAVKIIEDAEKIDLKQMPAAKESLKRDYDRLTRLYAALQKSSIDYQLRDIAEVDLPLGWTADWKLLSSATGEAFYLLLLKKIGGLLLTTFMITFGAPFWNDILSALVGIKNMSLRKA